MRRYLHGQLDANETRQVELHLANCAHCSASLVNYIETEESDQYNTYAKQLSGKLKEQKISKRSSLSAFQTRALRASAAVVTLLIFSFFGVKTIINKEVTDYSTEGKAVAVKTRPIVASKAKPVKKATPAKEATEQETTKKVTENKVDNRLSENRPIKVVKKPTTTSAKKEVAKSARSATTEPAAQQPKIEVEKTAEPKVAAIEKVETIETKPEPIEKKVAKVEKLDNSEGRSNETQETESTPAPIKTLPAVKKMDASKKIEISKPVGSTTPQVAPIPGGRLR
jgi:hypothetical protein